MAKVAGPAVVVAGKDYVRFLDRGESPADPGVFHSAGGQFDWQRVVLSSGWETRYVVLARCPLRSLVRQYADGVTELSLTVPLANSSAFLFTVLGEWYVERKVIAKETWLGLFLVLGGIAVCVHSKNQTG